MRFAAHKELDEKRAEYERGKIGAMLDVLCDGEGAALEEYPLFRRTLFSCTGPLLALMVMNF